MEKKDSEKKNLTGRKIAAVAGLVLLYAFGTLMEEGGGGWETVLDVGLVAVLPFVFILGFIALIVWLSKNAKAGQSAAKTAPARPAARTTPRRTAARRSARAGEDCDYGDANHEYSHDMERRIAQLDSFLKNGLIDKKEYNELLRRYTESSH